MFYSVNMTSQGRRRSGAATGHMACGCGAPIPAAEHTTYKSRHNSYFRLGAPKMLTFVVLSVLSLGVSSSLANKVYLTETNLDLLVDNTILFNLVQIGEYKEELQITAKAQHPDIMQLVPSTVVLPSSETPNATAVIQHAVCALGKTPGHSEVTFNVTPKGYLNVDFLFMRVTVMHSHAIYVISYIMGWIYFVAWSVSFYPQIFTNFQRKSVVGLNFDFLALNLLGFALYSLFNCGLFFSSDIKGEYFSRYPRGLNPVQLNDVFFSLHAVFATLITIAQCVIYERESQRVSVFGCSVISIFVLVVGVTATLGAVGVVAWLDFLYYCSYIKLCITLIKYVPQAYMNYLRKSTVGWSIGNIFLDFVGGSLSVLQMLLNAYNYNDWVSIFGDVTKFGLGAFSLIFDVFFMMQHYVFYRSSRYEELLGANDPELPVDVDCSGEQVTADTFDEPEPLQSLKT